MSEGTDIAFIGGGNMAGSLVGGLLAAGWEPARLAVADPDPDRRDVLRGRFPGLRVEEDNARAAAGAGLVVLAVKPQAAHRAIAAAAPTLRNERPVILSIAAGLRIAAIEAAADAELAVARAMPNTPALVGKGISAVYANERVDASGLALARSVLEAVGEVVEVERESLLDAVTAVSGSGPAYFFLLVESLAAAGARAGLAPPVADRLATATGIGAMALLERGGESPAALRERVTSPGGTTAAALEVFAHGDFEELVARAVMRASERAHELGTE